MYLCVCLYRHVSCKTFAQNAGAEGAVVVVKLLEQVKIYREKEDAKDAYT